MARQEECEVVILANPNAGARDARGRVQELAAELLRLGLPAFVTTQVRDLRHVRPGQKVVAAGGDGTVLAAVENMPPGTPLGILPMGTENLAAREFRIPASPEGVAEVVSNGETADLDLGELNGKPFLIMASAGFDAEVVRAVHSSRAANVSRGHYLKATIRALARYRFPEIVATPLDPPGEPLRGNWALAANLPAYGAGFRPLPQASGTSGELELLVGRVEGPLQKLWMMGQIYLQRHLGHPRFQRAVGKRFRLESAHPCPVQADGDPMGELPAEVGISSQRLRLLVPRRDHGLEDSSRERVSFAGR